MKKLIVLYSMILGLCFYTSPDVSITQNRYSSEVTIQSRGPHDADQITESVLEPELLEENGHEPVWLVIPFVALLLMIATGPLFYEHFWHHNYPKIAIALAVVVVGYYLFVLHNVHQPVHALAEYVQFIALLASLFVASGGILIDIDKKS